MFNTLSNNYSSTGLNTRPAFTYAPSKSLFPDYIEQTNPSKTKYSANLITQYLNNLSVVNSLNIKTGKEFTTPSEVSGYNNYIEVDDFGNEVVNLHYSKENDSIVQNIKTKSLDGTTVNRVTKNSPNTKSLSLTIRDKNGNLLLRREKTNREINNDTRQTIVNGEVYNVYGLSKNVITVEHNGEISTIDLEKMLNQDVVTGKDEENNRNIIRDTKITNEEKEELFNKIKSYDGDDLARLSKCTKSIQYYAGMDSFFEPTTQTLQLQIKKGFDKFIDVHELGHGYSAKDNKITGKNLSDSNELKTIRETARNNYLNGKDIRTLNDKICYNKFLNTENYLDHYNNDLTNSNLTMQDEIFAESYNLLNTADIINFDDGIGCPSRLLSFMKYLPKALIEVNKQI